MKEGRPIDRGERGRAEKKMGSRWGGARGEEAKQNKAANGAGQKERLRKQDGRPMGRGDRGGGERKKGGR